MKKSLILGLLGLAATAMTTFGQGSIILDNYNTSGPYITYGQAGVPQNGSSGGNGTVGAPVIGAPGSATSPWTVGVYYALGDITGTVAADPSHVANPTTLGAFTQGTGNGTSAFIDNNTTGVAGAYLAGSTFLIPGTLPTGGSTVTLMIVAYSGATYNASNYRGHSAAFTVTTTAFNATSPTQTGAPNASGFGVFIAVPEPSVLALSGIGGALLMLFRRKKA